MTHNVDKFRKLIGDLEKLEPLRIKNEIIDPNADAILDSENLTCTSKNGFNYYTLPSGQLHREDGPAVEYIGDRSDRRHSWYLNGCSFKNFDEWLHALNIDDTEDYVILKLKYQN